MAMTYGVCQEYYNQHDTFGGSKSATGVVGTTMNGVMYLVMPILSTILDSGRWAKRRRIVAIAGVILSSIGFFASSWSTQVWHFILLQGVVAPLGSAMLFSPTTLFLDEYFKHGNRATAYGVSLSSKNITGTACPFLMYVLLEKLGFRAALQVWAAVVFATGLFGIFVIPKSSTIVNSRRPRKIPWAFLKHRTFYIYAIGNAVFSSGYGLPQTYLPQYASSLLHLSSILSTVMIALFNVPGIISCTLFGYICDKSRFSAATNTQISTLCSALCVFFLWGLKSNQVPGLLIAFSICYGFFAGGYSSTWGGWIKEFENEASDNNEAINTGMLYGLMNGARGIGYVVGGLVGVELLKVGSVGSSTRWAYGTKFGAIIVFTGVCSLFGGWAIVWSGCSKVFRRLLSL
jgi:MFS family permease